MFQVKNNEKIYFKVLKNILDLNLNAADMISIPKKALVFAKNDSLKFKSLHTIVSIFCDTFTLCFIYSTLFYFTTFFIWTIMCIFYVVKLVLLDTSNWKTFLHCWSSMNRLVKFLLMFVLVQTRKLCITNPFLNYCFNQQPKRYFPLEA